VPCAATLAVLQTIQDDDLLAHAREMGRRLRNRIELLGEGTLVRDARGQGLLLGVELHLPVSHEVVLAMIREGVLATEAGADVVRMSPPLVVSPDEIDQAAEALTAAIGKVAAEEGWSP